MLPYFDENVRQRRTASTPFGHEARDAVDAARQSIAAAIGADAKEIVFTSGATESNNLAIRGVAERERRRGNHLVSVTTEHKAVLDPLARLARRGYEVTLLDVEQHGSPRAGWLDPQKVADAIRDDTCLVSVMLANNEIGVIQPLAEIAAICRERGVLLHCDATQAVGKIPVDVAALGVDLMSFTAHKIYGPKGIGALYVRRRDPIVRLEPQIAGGGQQEGRRSGTLNVPGIVGFATALATVPRRVADRNAAARRRCAINWPPHSSSNSTTCDFAARRSTHATTTARRCACPAISTSRSATSTAKRCCWRWATWPSAAAPPARRPIPSPATCCGHWASATTRPAAACDSAWAGSTRRADVDLAAERVVEAVRQLRKLASSCRHGHKSAVIEPKSLLSLFATPPMTIIGHRANCYT